MADYGWRDTHVLECSQVRTPAEFWALYLERLEVRAPAEFGRNLDALWDALSREGPGVPAEPCHIEIRNHEALAAEHPAFVEKLAEMAAELDALKGAFLLSLCKSFPVPRGNLYKHDCAAYVSHEAKGMRLLALFWERQAPRSFLILQCSGGIWQRFFIDDVGPVCWDELDTEVLFSAHEPDELEDVSALLGPRSSTVEHILDRVEASPWGQSSVEITLMSGATIRFAPSAPGDFESDFVLRVETAG
ncbi:MAG: barstar family protein [Polyangiales bacterium]